MAAVTPMKTENSKSFILYIYFNGAPTSPFVVYHGKVSFERNCALALVVKWNEIWSQTSNLVEKGQISTVKK